MDLNLDETETEVYEVFSRFFEKECPPGRVRAAEPLGFDQDLWRQLVDMGILTMTIPAEAGGEGAPFRLAALATEPMGSAVAPAPMIDSLVTTRLLARCRERGGGEWLGRICNDGVIVTLALRPWQTEPAQLVPSGAIAEAVVGLDGDRIVLGELPVGHRQSPMNIGTSPIARCSRSEEVLTLAEGPPAKRLYEEALAEWKCLMASAMVGMAGSAFDLILEYVKERKAFDMVLGAFQTVAHRLADSAVEIDGARFLAREAAWMIDEAPGSARGFSAAAFAFCSETAYTTANHCLHMHGGVGYTMEHDAQLYYRRAKAWPLLYGDPAREYQVVADEVFGGREV